MAIKPYLQLVRLPNLFTAAADPLAGWLVVTGTLAGSWRWAPLLAASVLIYAGGIVLNDVFDVEIDRRERPGRPLPSGQVPFRFAAWFGGVALGLGPLVAALSGSWVSASVAGVLTLMVLAYDAGMKRTLLGPVVMGVCRSLNLLLGFSQAADLGGPWAWLLALTYGVTVTGVTVMSRSEVESSGRWGLALGALLQCIGAAALRVGVVNLIFAKYGIRPGATYPEWGVSLNFLVALFTLNFSLRAVFQPTPAHVQRAVKVGVLSFVWLDVAMVAGVEGLTTALIVAALWVPAFVTGRWLYST